MQKRIESLATKLAANGLSRKDIHQLVALAEANGTPTEETRNSLAEILARDGWVGKKPKKSAHNFVGIARHELKQYLGFLDRVLAHKKREAAPVESLFGPGKADVNEGRYRQFVEAASGERPAVIKAADGSTRTVTFKDRFLPSPNHQLDDMLLWFQNHYDRLGFQWELQPVPWKGGKVFYNLIVTIPGEEAEAVVLCDHYDVADKELITDRNKLQLKKDHKLKSSEIRALMDTLPEGAPVPGANDNGSATGALMEMGELMRARLDAGIKLKKTLKLVHLVGEELPADCLGGKELCKQMIANGDPLRAVIVLDMIAVDRLGKRKMQLSPGRNKESLELAAMAKDAVHDLGLDLKPVLRPYKARKSFVHQTDADEFSKAGVRVLLVNEFLNDDHNLYRVGYHDEFDTTRLMSFDYAADMVRGSLELTYRLLEPRAA